MSNFNPSEITAEAIFGKIQDSPLALPIVNKEARDEIKRRITEAARQRRMITYSDLVRGIKFDCPDISSKPFEIITFDWTGPARRMIGNELARLTMETVKECGCIMSTVVVDKTENQPSKTLFEWLVDCKILPDLHDATIEWFWIDQVKRTFEYFKTH